jgi:isopenicillin N synthase-like dioxygenase
MSATLLSLTLPTLDLRRFDANAAERAGYLRAAVRHLGFVYLVGHGIDTALTADVLTLSHRSFALPEEEKLAIEMVNSPHFRGYNRAGFEHTRGKPNWREQVDIGSERAALPVDPSAPPWTRLQGPNQWPAALPELKATLLEYQERATALAVRVLQAFAAALEQPENAFEAIYSPAPHQLLKLIRYPGRAPDEGDQGVGAHKDSGFLSILLQEKVGGLQVEGDRGWIDAPPKPGTFVVNIGEILEMASDGYLRANVHRVVSPPLGADRLSVAFFLGARLDATVPLLSLPPHLAA